MQAMQPAKAETSWFFVDESGDPAFYGNCGQIIVGQPGCSRVLLLGFVRCDNPVPARKTLLDLRDQIASDRYLQPIPSLSKSLRAFHAKDDCPEVRKLVFQTLDQLESSVQVIVARKLDPMFRGKYHKSQDRFYEDLVSRLFENQVHKSERNVVVFARRGNKLRQHALRAAVEKGAGRFRHRWKVAEATEVIVETSQPSAEPLLQAIDYANWAVQRAFERREMRYFDFLRSKFEMVWDIFDTANYMREGRKGGNIYTRKNPFEISKCSAL
jgi:hypothetical protein